MCEETKIPLEQIQLTKGGKIMKPKAFIYGEQPHKELSIHEVPLWSFNDPDNTHEIENQKQMADDIVATRGSLNNHLIYSQSDYPGIIYNASRTEPLAKISNIKYNEDTKTFVADIISTNQLFIDMVAKTASFPRVHPCYEAETHHVYSYKDEEPDLQSTTSIFKRLLCWLIEPMKPTTQISVEYHPEGISDKLTEEPLIISDSLAKRMAYNTTDTIEMKDNFETFLLNKYDESENENNDVMNNPTVEEIPLPKDDVYNAILKKVRPILDASISNDGKYGWIYGERFNTFYWRIHKRKMMLQIGASLVFEVENKCWVWEIHTHNTLNVNVKVYPDRVVLRDESCSDYDDFYIDFMRNLRDDLAERLDEYNQKYRNESKSDTNNEKTILWETMKTGINTTLNSFCDKIISSSITGGSYKRSGCLRQIFLGGKIIDIIHGFDVDLDSWTIFIGDTEKPCIFINSNGDITTDTNSFIPDPLCSKDIQTLCDMLNVCKNKNWQVREDTREERMESCEASDDKVDISKLIPKEELMKIIFENVKGILENNLDYHKYSWACPDNSWSLTSYDDSFRYVVYDRQNCVSKSIGCKLDKDHWEIYTEKGSNVNLVVYPDEARWMTDDILMRNSFKDFPKGIFEDIIKDINTWIKTKTMPNKELSAFSQRLIKDGKRPTKDEYYLAMAEVASTSGTCLRRRFGAVIVKNNRIVSTGYVGAPSGREHCSEIGYCFREHNKIPSGTMYEKCRSTHAEMNAIIQASKEEMEGATLYLVGVEPDGSYTNADCCAMCKRVIINSGIEKVVAKQKNGMYLVIPVKEWVRYDDSLDINHKGY